MAPGRGRCQTGSPVAAGPLGGSAYTGQMSRSVAVVERRPDRRPGQTIRKLLDAGAAELRATSFSVMTMRSVAARAGVSSASAYTYFPSKNALVATLYLETLKTVPLQPDNTDNPKARVKAALRAMMLAGADEPELRAACATAMAVRGKFVGEVARRLRAALGTGLRPSVQHTLGLTFAGALMSARFLTDEQIAKQLDASVDLILGASIS